MENPFLSASFPPDFRAATPETAENAIIFALDNAKKNIAKIESLSEAEANFNSVVRALDNADKLLSQVWTLANHLESVVSSAEMRGILAKYESPVSEFYSSICTNEILWQKILVVKNSGESLNRDESKLLADTVFSFEQNGANLPPSGKERLKALDLRLAGLTRKFSENALDAQNAFELNILDESELDGLPDSAKSLARSLAAQKGKSGFLLTLDAPVLMPVLAYCKNENLRKTLWLEHSNLCFGGGFDNTELIRDILKTRLEKAELLGKKNFADFVLADRMAKNGKTALEFIESLHSKILKYFKRDIAEIEAFAKKSPIEPWNSAYYAELMRRENYDFSGEEFRPYITLEGAFKGAFLVADRLYGLRFEKAEAESWHKDVEFFNVFDKSGRRIASFYADFFPRKGKRAGAWMNLLIDGETKLGVIAGNFNAPSGGVPPLLNFDELSTLFHEFGHLIHFILMDSPERGLRNVAWDFVELPSQIMENWCAKKEILDTFARHYKSGEKLPDSIFEKFEKSKKFRGASFFMRQLSFAKIDLDLHINTKKYLGCNIEAEAKKTLESYSQKYSAPTRTILPHFTHVCGDPVGYAAGYYSYKWAEALDADAFTRFESGGILNPSIGAEFADKILKVGKSVPPEEAFKSFMGRDPDPDALIRRQIET